MSKAMTQATGGHNLRVVMALIAVLLIVLVALVFALRPAPTASDREANPAANPAMRAEDKGGSRSVNYDPAIDRHAEVVQRLGNDSVRQAPR